MINKLYFGVGVSVVNVV